jgi:hypothetical protein
MRAMGVYPTEKQWVQVMLDEIQVTGGGGW